MVTALRVLLLITLVTVAAVRIHLLPVPMDPDEGCYSYVARLWLEGHPPAVDTPDYPMPGIFGVPGIYLVYVFMMKVFGPPPVGIHLGLLLANLTVVGSVFWLGRKLCGPETGSSPSSPASALAAPDPTGTTTGTVMGTAAAAAYAVMSLSPAVIGFNANTEHFVLFFSLLGLVLLKHAMDHDRWAAVLGAGLLCGSACLIKQPGLFFVICGGAWILLDGRRRAVRLILFGTGALLPLILTCLWYLEHGTFGRFAFWAFQYPVESYLVRESGRAVDWIWASLPFLIQSFWPLWTLALAGLVTAFLKRRQGAGYGPLIAFFLFSVLAVCPGFYFWQHYYILALPALSLLAGLAVSNFFREGQKGRRRFLRTGTAFLAIFLSLGWTVWADRIVLFRLNPKQVLRVTYGPFPLTESIVIGDFIRERTSPGDRVAVLGSDPQILYYSGRRSATRHLFIEHVMGTHRFAQRMQQEVMDEVETARPKFIVFNPAHFSGPGSRALVDWFWKYRRRSYRLVGVVDILTPEETRYVWGASAEKYRPVSPYWLMVLERKSP